MKFSLLTYNIWSGKYWKEIIRFLQEKSADVICLQEVGVYNQYHKEAKDVDICAELKKALLDYKLIYAPVRKRYVEKKKNLSETLF